MGDEANNVGSCSCSLHSRIAVSRGDERRAWLVRNDSASSACLGMGGLGIAGVAGHMNKGSSPVPGQTRALWPMYRAFFMDAASIIVSQARAIPGAKSWGEEGVPGNPLIPCGQMKCAVHRSHKVYWVLTAGILSSHT